MIRRQTDIIDVIGSNGDFCRISPPDCTGSVGHSGMVQFDTGPMAERSS